MNLEEIFAALQALLALDADLAPIPFLGQIASAVENAPAVRDYKKHLEAALSGVGDGNVGVAFVAVVSEGDDRAPATGLLDLVNTVMLSVVVNPVTNTTGLTAYQYTRRALRVLKRGRVAQHGARWDISLASPAFNVGPLNQGTEVFFINLLVRTTEDLGALNPAV